MSPDLAGLSAREITLGVKSGRFTAASVTEALLGRIERLNPQINAYTTVTADRAVKEAADVDRALAEGRDPGPLAGVPFSVKNLFDLEGVVTLAGSKVNRENPPAARDSSAAVIR